MSYTDRRGRPELTADPALKTAVVPVRVIPAAAAGPAAARPDTAGR
jgi:hypothetical protein